MSINGAIYHFTDLSQAEAAGVYTPPPASADPNEPEPLGRWHHFVQPIDWQGWLVPPVRDEEGGDVLEPGIRPHRLMILAPLPIASLEPYRIHPHGVAGLSGPATL